MKFCSTVHNMVGILVTQYACVVFELTKRKLHLRNSLNPNDCNDFIRLSACLNFIAEISEERCTWPRHSSSG
jgi:hypothetical protein